MTDDHIHDDDRERADATDATDGDFADEKTSAERDETPAEDAGQRSLSRALNLSFLMLKGLMFVIVVLFLLDCAQQIDEGSVGLVRRFGRYRQDETGAIRTFDPGLHFVWFEPVERLETVSLRKRELALDTVFWPWTGSGAAGDTPLAKEAFDPEQDGYNLTADQNIIHTKWSIEYDVDPAHPEDYLLATVDPDPNRTGEPGETRPEDLLQAVARSVIVRNIAGTPVDDVLIRNKDRLRQRVRADLEREMRDPERPDRYLAGLRVLEVNLSSAMPPGRVKPMFDAVQQAITDSATTVDRARGEASTTRAVAGTRANQIRGEARVYKTEVVASTSAYANRIQSLLDQYPDDPDGLRAALDKFRLDLVRESLSKAKLIVMEPDASGVLLVTPSMDDLPGTTN